MWKIPLFDTTFDHQELEAVQSVIQSGWLTMGQVTREFERQFAEYLGVKHAIAVSNGTTALHLANAALDIGIGDEVICPALTFVAGSNSIIYTGATPIFADIKSLNDLTISPEDIETKITPRTKAIQVMHYGGYPCDMEQILAIANKYNISVIEDAAHTPRAEYNGKQCGAIGTIGCFSFFSNKNMTTGEGGMVTTNDDQLAKKIRLMRSHGMTSLTLDRHKGRAHSYDVVELGYNYRIDEIRAALGMSQLAKLGKNAKDREKITNHYKTSLRGISLIHIPFENFKHKSSHHIFPILLDKSLDRQWFMDAMKSRGIQTSIHYPPIHLFNYYTNKFGYKGGELPLTEDVASRELTLPLYPSMSIRDVDFVCNAIKEITGGLS